MRKDVNPVKGKIIDRVVLGEGSGYYDMAGRWAGLKPDRGGVCKKLDGVRRLTGRHFHRRVRLVAEVLSDG